MIDDTDEELAAKARADREEVFARHADVIRRNARLAERRGLEHLERGLLVSAIRSLQEAVELYTGLHDEALADSAKQYKALAMYEQGDVDTAVAIWEGMIARGWDRPTTLNFLVRHYESRGDREAARRIYDYLRRAQETGSGIFADFGPSRPKDSLAAEKGGKPKLMVADNDPDVRHVLGRILENQGYPVVYAEDGESALAVLFETAPDLAFIDVYMPRLSGLDVLYRMRAEGIRTPVIVMSGRPHAPMVQDAKTLGARFASKPFNFEELSTMVAEVLAEVRR